jgi:molybdenum cofactor guanylyltransferase
MMSKQGIGQSIEREAHAPDRHDVTGLVLAGGMGQRMGGQDKGLLPFRGRPLAAWVIDRVAPQVGRLLINANRNIDEYARFGYPVISDSIGGYPGPLAGVHTGLGTCATNYLLCVPCDSPFLPTDLCERLMAALLREGADAATARCGERLHPVFSLLRRNSAAELQKYLAAGGRNIRGWFDNMQTAFVDFPDPEAFQNLNTPDDLRLE